MDVIYDRGVYIPGIDLWMDSTVKRKSSVISHAHSDHVANHHVPILTESTLRLLQVTPRRWDPIILEFGEQFKGYEYTLSFYPAGHCLGSAQTLVESHKTGEKILYSGDIKLEPSPISEPIEVVQSDTLILEATYGRPEYKFPPEEKVVEFLFQTLDTFIKRGNVPVILSYKIGKAQEVIAYLIKKGFSVVVDETIHVLCKVHSEMGVKFPGSIRKYDGQVGEREVLVFPPSNSSKKKLSNLRGVKFIRLSGWSIDPYIRRGFSAHVSLPLSDHPDFDGLLQYVEMVSAKRIFTVNGFPDLAENLRGKGYDAVHLSGKVDYKQLDLL